MCVTEILHVRNNFIGCVENLKSMCRGYTTRFACNAPALTGHPLYEQRGNWTAAIFATKVCDFSRGQLRYFCHTALM